MAQYVFRGSTVSVKGMMHDEARHELLPIAVYTAVMFGLACITYGIAVPSGLFVPVPPHGLKPCSAVASAH